MLRVVAPLGLAAAVTIFAALAGGPVQATALFPRSPALAGPTLGELEGRAARAPSAEALSELAAAYLDRDQPGLAQAALERAPGSARREPEFRQLEARIWLRRGRAQSALAAARSAQKACEARDGGCAAWFEARTARQLGYLEELVSAGVDDPEAAPEAALAAYERSAREARLVAMR